MIGQWIFKTLLLLQGVVLLVGCTVQASEQGWVVVLPVAPATAVQLEESPAAIFAAAAQEPIPAEAVTGPTAEPPQPFAAARQATSQRVESSTAPRSRAAGDFADLRAKLLTQIETASLTTAYRSEAIAFMDHLLAHLHEFQLAHLGITSEQMKELLDRDGSGARINALVQEVWEEWVILSQQQGFDVRVTQPTLELQGLSPFRQLVIRLIQNRQGTLGDSEQHALHGFFARYEAPAAWQNDMDSIIGAVNRESFLWFYQE